MAHSREADFKLLLLLLIRIMHHRTTCQQAAEFEDAVRCAVPVGSWPRTHERPSSHMARIGCENSPFLQPDSVRIDDRYVKQIVSTPDVSLHDAIAKALSNSTLHKACVGYSHYCLKSELILLES